MLYQQTSCLPDVGSGAGSQSRAADTHLILRPHAVEDAVVIEAVVRSFPPPPAKCLRWEFPAWRVADDLDPADLREPQQRRRRKAEAAVSEPATPAEPPWDARRFADAFGTAVPKTRAVILDDARSAGLSDRLAGQLLQAAIDREFLYAQAAPDNARNVRISNVEFARQRPRNSRVRRKKK